MTGRTADRPIRNPDRYRTGPDRTGPGRNGRSPVPVPSMLYLIGSWRSLLSIDDTNLIISLKKWCHVFLSVKHNAADYNYMNTNGISRCWKSFERRNWKHIKAMWLVIRSVSSAREGEGEDEAVFVYTKGVNLGKAVSVYPMRVNQDEDEAVPYAKWVRLAWRRSFIHRKTRGMIKIRDTLLKIAFMMKQNGLP